MLLILTVTGSGRSQSLLFNENSGFRNIGFQIPISLHDNDNGNDDSGTHAVCIRFIQKSLCIHFPFPKFKSFLRLKFIVYSTHHFLHPKFTVLQIIIFFIQYSLFIQISTFFIQKLLFIQIIVLFFLNSW